MKVKYVPIFALVGVLTILSGMPLLLSSGSVTNYANAKYSNTNTQSQGNANDCDTGTNCAITSPQTQGDGTANSPTNLQISGSEENEEEQPPEPPQSFREGTIFVSKHIICPEGFVCPSATDFRIEVVRVAGDRALISPSSFQAAPEGQNVEVVVSHPSDTFKTFYRVNEVAVPPTPAGLFLLQNAFGECGREPGGQEIIRGDLWQCDLLNTYLSIPPPPPTP
jgi:hypothetical protein